MSKPCLRVAVIGTGRWGKNLVRVFGSLEQAELVSVCDVDAERLRALDTPAERVTDYRSVLSDSRIDAVVIATPPNTHADLAVASFEAGKHVFVEKPMALCSADAWRVVRAAETARKRGMVGYVMLHHPAITQLKQWIQDGALGDVRRIVATRRGPPGGPNEPGPWWSLAPHDVNLACFLFEGTPTSITLSQGVDGGTAAIDARLRFPGGRVAELNVAVGALAKIRKLVVQGTLASALFDDGCFGDKLTLVTTARDGRAPPAATAMPDLPAFEPLRIESAHFVGVVLSGGRLLSDVHDGARTVRLLESGIASSAPLAQKPERVVNVRAS